MLQELKMGRDMFHYEDRHTEMPVSYDAYFYIPVATAKLYTEKKEKAFDHNYSEDFKFCPVTGKELWKVSRENLEFFSKDKTIVDPKTGEELATVFERIDLFAIGYKLELGQPFSIPYDKIKKLLVLLKGAKVIPASTTYKDFKIIHMKDTFDFLRFLPRKDWGLNGPEKRYGVGGPEMLSADGSLNKV
jgi:hypothetical protein